MYLGFYVSFNTVEVISQWVFERAEEISTYSSLGFCTVNCRPTASNYQLSHLRPCRESNPNLRGGRLECYHSATVAPNLNLKGQYKVIMIFALLGTVSLFIYLFGVLHCFQHCTGHITTGSWKSRGNEYIQFVRVLYCKLLTNSKQLPAFPLEVVLGIEPRPQGWEARVLPLCHLDP